MSDRSLEDLIRRYNSDIDADDLIEGGKALARIEDARAIKALAEGLTVGRYFLREPLAEALREREESSLAQLITLLDDPDRIVRHTAIVLLCEIGNPLAIPPLLKLLETADERDAFYILMNLTHLPDPRAAEPLLAIAFSDDQTSSRQAAFALVEIGTPEIIERCLEELADGNEESFQTAALILSHMKEQRAIPLLARGLESTKENVREDTEKALALIRGEPDALERYWAAQKPDPAKVAEYLNTAATPEGRDQLVEQFLSHQLHSHSAVEAFKQIADEVMVEKLCNAITEADSGRATQALWALREIKSPLAVGPLSAVLVQSQQKPQAESPRPSSDSIVNVLYAIGTEEALAAIERHIAANGWPTTVDQAVDRLISEVPPVQLDLIGQMSEIDLYDMHFGLGLYIRNNFGFYQGNVLLRDACSRRNPLAYSADECSTIILRSLWHRVRNQQAADGPIPA